jgi:hypothetical protein
MARIVHLGYSETGFYANLIEKEGEAPVRHPMSAQAFADVSNTLLQYVLERGLEARAERISRWPNRSKS